MRAVSARPGVSRRPSRSGSWGRRRKPPGPSGGTPSSRCCWAPGRRQPGCRVRKRPCGVSRSAGSVGVGPVSPVLIGAPPGWVCRVKVRRALFPPRCGTVRRPHRRCRSSPRSAQWRSGGPGGAAVGYGAVSVTAPARARLWPSRGAAAPRWLAATECSRRRSPSAGYSSHHRTDSGRPENTLGHGTRAVRSAHSGSIRAHSVHMRSSRSSPIGKLIIRPCYYIQHGGYT